MIVLYAVFSLWIVLAMVAGFLALILGFVYLLDKVL